MRGLFGFLILQRLFGNPFIALFVLLVLYSLIDMRFVGLLPDLSKPFRQAGAVRRLKQTLELNPHDANAHLELGTILAEKRRWAQAAEHLELAAKRLDNSQSYYRLGTAYFHLGRLDEGKEALQKALQMNPKVGYGEPYVYLAEYQLKKGGSLDELEGLDEALAQYGSVDVLYRIGRLYEEAGDRDRARNMYEEALETYKGYPGFLRKQQRRTALKAWFKARLAA